MSKFSIAIVAEDPALYEAVSALVDDLIAAREKAGLSQRALARKLGVHHGTLNKYERKRMQAIPSLVFLLLWAEAVGLKLELGPQDK